MCNAAGLDLPDIPSLVRALAGTVSPESVHRPVLVLDTTALACTVQPFALPGAAAVALVTHESLTKYAQLGLDRVAAGMIVASEADGPELDDFREHLGTNAN